VADAGPPTRWVVPSAGVDVERVGETRGPVRGDHSEATNSVCPPERAGMRVGYGPGVRSVLAFYRARPLVGILVFVIGLAVAITTTTLQDDDGIVLPVAFVGLVGLLVGSVLALAQRRRR